MNLLSTMLVSHIPMARPAVAISALFKLVRGLVGKVSHPLLVPGHTPSLLAVLVVSATLMGTPAEAGKQKIQIYQKAIKKLEPVDRALFLPINYNGYLKQEEKSVVDLAYSEALKSLPFGASIQSLDNDKLRDFYTQVTMDLYGENPEELASFRTQLIETFNTDADIIITASVEQRLATLKGATARWDGVSFSISYDGGRAKEFVEWSGTYAGYSLRLDGYTPEGTHLFSSWGAIMFPKTADSEQSRFVRRNNALSHKEDVKNMKRGIRGAFKPFRKKIKAAKKK